MGKGGGEEKRGGKGEIRKVKEKDIKRKKRDRVVGPCVLTEK